MHSEEQSDDKIAFYAEMAGRELVDSAPGLDKVPWSRRASLIDEYVMNASQSSGSNLVDALRNDPSLTYVRNGSIESVFGGHQVQEHMLVHYIVQNVIEGIEARPPFSKMRAFAETKTSAVHWYTPIAGIRITGTTCLGENVAIVPWDDVPDGTQKSQFLQSLKNLEASISVFPMLSLRVVPASAVRFSVPKHEVLFAMPPNLLRAILSLIDDLRTRPAPA